MAVKLLHSSIRPVTLKGNSFFDQFENYASYADELIITSGYVSADSLLFLKSNVSKLPPMKIAVGMHHFDGFTRAQFYGLEELSQAIEHENDGEIRICKAFPFHGKVYSFLKNQEPFSALVGSSNLSCITPNSKNRRIYEVDLSVSDIPAVNDIFQLQQEILADKSSVLIDSYEVPEFREQNDQMHGQTDVEVLSNREIRSYWSQRQNTSFKLPLKCTERSNLNVYFGKGRQNTSTGLILPRPWYEVEVIVGKSITDRKNYPSDSEFTVVTDDGYKFMAKTQGQNSKNFRSAGNLSTLGAWIKGRMENAGVLKIGEFIDESILDQYGRRDIDLIATDDENTWLLDFSVTKT